MRGTSSAPSRDSRPSTMIKRCMEQSGGRWLQYFDRARWRRCGSSGTSSIGRELRRTSRRLWSGWCGRRGPAGPCTCPTTRRPVPARCIRSRKSAVGLKNEEKGNKTKATIPQSCDCSSSWNSGTKRPDASAWTELSALLFLLPRRRHPAPEAAGRRWRSRCRSHQTRLLVKWRNNYKMRDG